MKLKKYCTVFLAFIMYFNVFSQAHAAKNYNVKTIVYDPLEKVINATVLDQIAEKTMQKSAKVPVTSYATGSTVAAMIRMGIAGAAIYGLVQGVGWVIENGVVKKPVDNGQINTEFYWFSNTIWSDGDSVCKNPTRFSTGDPAVNEFKSCAIQNRLTDPSCAMNNFDQYKCKAYNRDGYVLDFFIVDRVKNQNYDPNQTLVPVSDTELGDKVNNSPQAPQILPDVYNPNNPAGGQAPQLTSDALDNAIPTPETDPTGSTKPKPNVDTDGDGKPDVYDPDKPSVGEDFTLPEFCSWAVTVCEWYKKYKEDSKQAEAQRQSEQVAWQREEIARQQEEAQREKERTFWEKVTEFFDWAQKDPEKEDTEVDVDNPDQTEPDTTISFSTACPAKIPLTFNWNGQTLDFSFDFTIWCEAVSTFVYPIVVALGSLHALYIVAGVRHDG
ncbi:hypothetical protein HUN33_14815 [Acinetobacter bereziniae]|uniref:virulence factor TspB C-terminal domain-related protein n=1 Tax=Acinetobacter bereziniae TaxID=106648 RepID=UPI0015804327|nr:virulence factor TspB C-terminal domain-related protein [Acinetobacter bereziniae]NUF65010.1 hypothetical protein [Acinetobacter bereziniae]NUG08464.1 hypothetical protein [Acinetobacter bereziniae]NUG65168.1 hypothetical protein [Acinetobacter bereziniae]NUG71436.1 hypothetical protein [Acinetobacter bereziniae]NUG81306.1 hypothetical protein [Acinetobacter bereziniae]